MVKLLRAYTQTIKTFCVDRPTTGKEYIVNIVTRSSDHKTVSYSVTYAGATVEDQDELDFVAQQLDEAHQLGTHCPCHSPNSV